MGERGERLGRFEIRVSGSGGQGILLAAAILAEAATSLGRQVVQTQSYGPEARGGSAKAEVIVADEAIDYPEALSPDINMCLSQAAYAKYAGQTRRGGLVLYDSGLVTPGDGAAGRRLCGLPFTRTAVEQLGKVVVANIVAVGALVAASEVLPAYAVEAAVVKRVPERFRELNVKAFRLGLDLGCDAGGIEGLGGPSAS